MTSAGTDFACHIYAQFMLLTLFNLLRNIETKLSSDNVYMLLWPHNNMHYKWSSCSI